VLDASFCIKVLNEALSLERPEIFNTNQSGLFAGNDFISALRKLAIGMDDCFAHSIFVERPRRGLKYEEGLRQGLQTKAGPRRGIAVYFAFYNHQQRPRQALGCRAPLQVFEHALHSASSPRGKTPAPAEHYQLNEMHT